MSGVRRDLGRYPDELNGYLRDLDLRAINVIYEKRYTAFDVALHVHAHRVGVFGYNCLAVNPEIDRRYIRFMSRATGVLRLPTSTVSAAEATYTALFYACRHVVSVATQGVFEQNRGAKNRGMAHRYMRWRGTISSFRHNLKLAIVVHDSDVYDAMTGRREITPREAVLVKRVVSTYHRESPDNITYFLAPVSEFHVVMWWWPWDEEESYQSMSGVELGSVLKQYAARPENYRMARGCMVGNQEWERERR